MIPRHINVWEVLVYAIFLSKIKVSTLWFHFWFLQVYLMNRYIHTSKHTQWLSLGMFYFICAFSFLLFFMLSKYPTTNVCIHFATRKKSNFYESTFSAIFLLKWLFIMNRKSSIFVRYNTQIHSILTSYFPDFKLWLKLMHIYEQVIKKCSIPYLIII